MDGSRASLHRRLKGICFNHDLKLQDLVDVIVEEVLSDESRLSSVLERMKG